MPLLAILDEAAFTELPDETVVGKDSYIKNEKTNSFQLALDGAEAGKLALPLQTELAKLKENNSKLLDEKIKTAAKVEGYLKLGKTPEEIDAILKAGKTETVEELERKYQAQLDSVKTEHQKQLSTMATEVESAKNDATATKTHLVAEMKRTEIAALKAKHGINGLGDDYFANRIEVVYDDESNQYFKRVVENGEIKYKAGQLMTPDQLAEEARLNKELIGMFNGGKGSGSGADARQQPSNAANGFIRAGDWDAMGANLEDIASGKLKVV
ncbi:hypothetical protein BH10ACI2_BH10ACI2_04260 [soil metagenome]